MLRNKLISLRYQCIICQNSFFKIRNSFKMSTLLFADFELLEANDLLSEGREVATLILNSSTSF